MKKVVIFWFRRDLRLYDNIALEQAKESAFEVLPLFIFDEQILGDLPRNDARVSFIHQQLSNINQKLMEHASSILIKKGNVIDIWQEMLNEYEIDAVYANEDYEPYGIQRDAEIANILKRHNIDLKRSSDHVIFKPTEVLKNDGNPYTVFTPYKNKWRSQFLEAPISTYKPKNISWFKQVTHFPSLQEIGFEESEIKVKDYALNELPSYASSRDFPNRDSTSKLGPHLRFGTVSIREMVSLASPHDGFLDELIWREFFIQILYHYPRVVNENFKVKYNQVSWRNNDEEFQRWKEGKTGYPIVDAGMRELNATGYMHNRVRMITASFLCKHLLTDWRWGEAYFAHKLLDFELASNNGNWQWAASTGCDAVPYFRIFNPLEQQKKFDKDFHYIRKWIPEFDSLEYPNPMVDHKLARERALQAYKHALQNER